MQMRFEGISGGDKFFGEESSGLLITWRSTSTRGGNIDIEIIRARKPTVKLFPSYSPLFDRWSSVPKTIVRFHPAFYLFSGWNVSRAAPLRRLRSTRSTFKGEKCVKREVKRGERSLWKDDFRHRTMDQRESLRRVRWIFILFIGAR